jgi:septum formation protein
MRFVLASASPARLDTLRRAGLRPEVVVSGVDESGIQADTVAQLVQRLSDVKARTVQEQLGAPPALILGCDSLLEHAGIAAGKPASPEVARERWTRLSGSRGVLHTGHCLIDTAANRAVHRVVSTEVRFATVSNDEIERYVATGEPSQVAGAFTLDGLGGWFVEGVEGDPHNVVGVSLPALRTMLHELGHDLATIGYPAAADDH